MRLRIFRAIHHLSGHPSQSIRYCSSANQPPLYPNMPGDYEATVARVVDGDTIAFQSPVLGATNVRFLNIDTPESDALH